MLELLRIRDLALIEDAELEFSKGLNVLTGETGAGKSFILRAIDFLTGERMGAEMVRPGKEKAVVEALFARPEGDLVIRRELSAETGRSRVYLGDRLGSQEAVLELRPSLVLHTSQHGQQKLLQPAYQARILDGFLPEQSLLAEREEALSELRRILERRRELTARTEELARQREFLEFQRAEIEKVDPLPGEEEELLARKESARDREHAAKALAEALDILGGDSPLTEGVAALARDMEAVSALFPEFEEERLAVEDFRLRLQALQNRLRRAEAEDGETIDLDALESRLFEISRLKRKLNKSLEQILALRDEIVENLNFLDSCGLDLKRLDKDETAAAKRLGDILARLNAARRAAGERLCRALEAELRGLGFSEHARVEYAFEPSEPYPGLAEDRARLLWVPNPGQPPRPLDKIASGGELSRFLLAVTSLKSSDELPTLIFDEVDAGIGGHTLNKVGDKLKSLAGRQQMLLITHWPQLASLAERHFLVSKEVEDGVTYTRCRRLGQTEIAAELTRMAGGGAPGASGASPHS